MANKKNEKKTTKKNNKKIFKILIPIFVVVLIGVALVVVLTLPDDIGKNENSTIEPEAEAKISEQLDKDNIHQAEPATNAKGEVEENGHGQLLSYYPRNIKKMDIENTKSKYTITSYTPVEKTTDADGKETEETQATQYTLVGHEDLDVMTGKPDEIANDAASLEFTKIVSVNGKEDKEFGFEKPRATVKITYEDKSSATVVVGAKAPTNAGVYIKFGTNNAIYLVEETAVDSFLYSLNDLVNLEMTPSLTSGDTSTPEKVVLSGTLYKETVEFSPSTDESAESNYIITKPKKYYGNDSTCSEVEAGIRGITANSVEYINPTDAQIEKCGLATPYAEIQATYSDNTTHLVAGKPDSKGYCYIMNKGGNVIYKILSDSVKWTQQTLDTLRSDFFIDNTMSSVAKTEVTFGKNNYTFDLSTKSASVNTENGQDKTTVAKVMYKGQEVSRGAYQSAFDYMHGQNFLRHEFTNESLSSSPAMTVKFTYKSDTGRSADELKLYDMGNQKYYGVVNGEQISYVFKNSVTDLQRLFTAITTSSPKDDEN